VATTLGGLLARRRRLLRLTLGDVARRAGYLNISKGANRLAGIERGEPAFPDARVLDRFARALGLTEKDVDQARCEDFERLDRPVPPSLIDRVMPGVYLPVELPANCTVDRAVELATAHAAATGRKVCVAVSRICGIYVEPDGTRSGRCALPSLSGAAVSEALHRAIVRQQQRL
jgi:transcriptional regulator with XRE-family HTH domain